MNTIAFTQQGLRLVAEDGTYSDLAQGAEPRAIAKPSAQTANVRRENQVAPDAAEPMKPGQLMKLARKQLRSTRAEIKRLRKQLSALEAEERELTRLVTAARGTHAQVRSLRAG